MRLQSPASKPVSEDEGAYDTSEEQAENITGSSYLQRLHRWKAVHSCIGWRFCLKAGMICSAVIMLINVSALTWAFFRARTHDSGRATLYQGDCSKVHRVNTAIHLYINFSSTLLLVASNFSMQCLSAPTRRDIDRAHAKKIWLDIDIPSFRNIPYIRKRNAVLWICLATTSTTLHLL